MNFPCHTPRESWYQFNNGINFHEEYDRESSLMPFYLKEMPRYLNEIVCWLESDTAIISLQGESDKAVI